MKKPILLFIGLCLAATITAQEKPAGNGWWNNNPSLVMPIREVGVTGIRPMKEIGVQKTQLDTLVLHENIALSMADVLTFNTAIFIKQYGRATLSTVAFRGTAASHTQVMWNGMRINSPMLGMTDFSMIPSYFVDDATLLHGTSSLNVVGGGLGGFSRSPEGKATVAAFMDAYNNMVISLRNYKAQEVKGGLGRGGQLKVGQ